MQVLDRIKNVSFLSTNTELLLILEWLVEDLPQYQIMSLLVQSAWVQHYVQDQYSFWTTNIRDLLFQIDIDSDPVLVEYGFTTRSSFAMSLDNLF